MEKKPYLTKKEAGFLLDKKNDNLNKKVLALLKSGFLIPLKKGLYTTSAYVATNSNGAEEYFANIIYYPSYLSLEYVLQKSGFFPEAVLVYTSVSLKAPRVFRNRFGAFSYRKIKKELFTGYLSLDYAAGLKIKIATPAKALFDYFYFKPLRSVSNLEKIKDLRINYDLTDRGFWEEFAGYVRNSDSPKMKKIFRLIKKDYDLKSA